MLVNEVNRSAALAWSPLPDQPTLIASGTLAGTMNVDFDPRGKLEIFDILKEGSRSSHDPHETVHFRSAQSPERFHRLAWKHLHTDTYRYGLIVGGLPSGTINLWNPEPLIENVEANPLLISLQKHSGPVTTFDFNPLQTNLLASGGPNGEVLIWNLNDPKKPSIHTPGNGISSQPGSITSVSFHPKRRQILAAASSNGTTVIWDLREKRPAFSFVDPNRTFRCKAVSWHPDQPFQIAVASDDDDNAVIHLWDLHMTLSPARTFRGHTRGVTSLAWNHRDRDILVSTGKDHRTIAWDVGTTSMISEIGYSANWVLDAQFSPLLPNYLGTSSLDGKMRVYAIHDFENLPTPQSTNLASQMLVKQQVPNANDDLFNTKSASQHQSSTTILQHARKLENGAIIPPHTPAWLKRPCGVSFGFGSVLLEWGNSTPPTPQQNTQNDNAANGHANPNPNNISTQHTVHMKRVSIEHEFISMADQLEAALKEGDMKKYCESKISTSTSSYDKKTWSFIRALFETKHRTELQSLLDWDPEIVSEKVNLYLRSLPTPKGMLPEIVQANNNNTNGPEDSKNSDNSNTESTEDLFDSQGDPEDEEFSKLAKVKRLATMNGNSSAIQQQTITTNRIISTEPISLKTTEPSDQFLTKALIIGDFEAAVECCVRLGRMADALVLAACGGVSLWNSTQDIFFRQNQHSPYISLIAMIANKDLAQLVQRINLENWQEALVILCTYSSSEEFGTHCEMLGDRLASHQMYAQSALTYISAKSLDKAIGIWLKSHSANVPASITLHNLMEKIAILNAAINTSSGGASDSKVSDLVYSKYLQYGQMLANEGRFETALSYLSKLPSLATTPDAFSNSSRASQETALLVDRTFNALPTTVAKQAFGSNWTPSLFSNSHQQHQYSNSNTHSSTKHTNVQLNSTTSMTPGSKARRVAQPSLPNQNGTNGNATGFQPLQVTSFSASTHTHGQGVQHTPLKPQFTPVNVPPVAVGNIQPLQPAGVAALQQFGKSTTTHQQKPAFQFQPVIPPSMNEPSRQTVTETPIQTFVPGPAPESTSTIPGPSKKSTVKKKQPKAFAPTTLVAPPPSLQPSTIANANVPLENSQPPIDPPSKRRKSTNIPAPSNVTTTATMPLNSGLGQPISNVPPVQQSGMMMPSNNMQNFSLPQNHPMAVTSVPLPAPVVKKSRVLAPKSSQQQTQPAQIAPIVTPAYPPVVQNQAYQPIHQPVHQPIHQPVYTPPNPASIAPILPQDPNTAKYSHGQVGTHGPGGIGPAAPMMYNSTPMNNFSNKPPMAFQTHQPPAPAKVAPPPGKAKRMDAGSSTSATHLQSAYITGPQAEAAAKPKQHELSSDERTVLDQLASILNKIQEKNDEGYPDLADRYNELGSRFESGQIEHEVCQLLLEFAYNLTNSQYKSAQEVLLQLKNKFYHEVGSKAMLGLKRLLISAMNNKV